MNQEAVKPTGMVGLCAWCSRPLVPVAAAPHKRFCNQSHRLAYHNARRQLAYEALKEKEKSHDNS